MITENITIDDFASGNLVPVSGPAAPAPSAAAAPAPSAPAAPATQAPAVPATTTPSSSVPNEKELFKKLHATSYDPNSSLDKEKMDRLRGAVKKVGTGNFGKLAAAAYSKPSKTSNAPTVKFGDKNQETYIQVANGKFIPATNNDVKAGNQIWVRNPNKGQGETKKPNFVQVRTEKGGSLRPKSQLPGALGSLSNFLGDAGRTLDKTSRGGK